MVFFVSGSGARPVDVVRVRRMRMRLRQDDAAEAVGEVEHAVGVGGAVHPADVVDGELRRAGAEVARVAAGAAEAEDRSEQDNKR